MAGQGRNPKRQTGKSYELYQLQALNRIVEALSESGGGAGLATEATQLSVLSAISTGSSQDGEILLVRDTGDSDVVVQQITIWNAGIPTVTYKKVNGTVH